MTEVSTLSGFPGDEQTLAEPLASLVDRPCGPSTRPDPGRNRYPGRQAGSHRDPRVPPADPLSEVPGPPTLRPADRPEGRPTAASCEAPGELPLPVLSDLPRALGRPLRAFRAAAESVSLSSDGGTVGRPPRAVKLRRFLDFAFHEWISRWPEMAGCDGRGGVLARCTRPPPGSRASGAPVTAPAGAGSPRAGGRCVRARACAHRRGGRAGAHRCRARARAPAPRRSWGGRRRPRARRQERAAPGRATTRRRARPLRRPPRRRRRSPRGCERAR